MSSPSQVGQLSSARMMSRWTVVGLLWIAFVVNYVDRQAVFSIYPVLRSQLGFSDAQLGLTGSMFIWVYSLCMPFAGRIADTVRRDRLIIASIVLWSFATLGTGLSSSFPVFAFWRGMVGFTESLYIPAALGLIATLHGTATRSRAIATHSTAQYLGILVGGWYGGWTADHLGWRTGFGILAVIGCAYAAILSRKLVDPRTQRAKEHTPRPQPVEVFSSRCFLAMCLAFFWFCVMLWMLYAWLPDFIYNRYHLSMSESGVVATLYLQGSSAVGVLLGGTLADLAVRRKRAARYYAAGTGLILCAPFAYLVLYAESIMVMKIAAVLFGLTAGLLMSNQFAGAYDVTAERNYGFAAGTLNMVGGLAGGAGILAAGLWKSSVGISNLMLGAAALTILSAVVLLATAALFFHRDRTHAGLLD